MKPVGENVFGCLTVWFHGHREALRPFVKIFTITQQDIHSFHTDRHLPAECPAKPLSFFFSHALLGSPGEMDVSIWQHETRTLSITWLGLFLI